MLCEKEGREKEYILDLLFSLCADVLIARCHCYLRKFESL
jgi:hypothetical protein